MSKLNVHVEGWKEVAARVTEAWHQAERSEVVDGGHHLSFTTWESLSAVLTAKRLELLRHLHRRPAVSIAALAHDLGRDYRRVHDDVKMLTNAGLVDRTPEGLHADYDSIQTTIAM